MDGVRGPRWPFAALDSTGGLGRHRRFREGACEMSLDRRTRRLMTASYLVSKRRAEAKARERLENLADLFEQTNEATLSEIRTVRSDLAQMHLIEDAMIERTEHGSLLH
jgi:hypothetical protein